MRYRAVLFIPLSLHPWYRSASYSQSGKTHHNFSTFFKRWGKFFLPSLYIKTIPFTFVRRRTPASSLSENIQPLFIESESRKYTVRPRAWRQPRGKKGQVWDLSSGCRKSPSFACRKPCTASLPGHLILFEAGGCPLELPRPNSGGFYSAQFFDKLKGQVWDLSLQTQRRSESFA